MTVVVSFFFFLFPCNNAELLSRLGIISRIRQIATGFQRNRVKLQLKLLTSTRKLLISITRIRFNNTLVNAHTDLTDRTY